MPRVPAGGAIAIDANGFGRPRHGVPRAGRSRYNGIVRLFAGVWPSDEVVDVLTGLRRPSVPGVRWTGAGQWHVTLAFLGEVTEDAVEEVAAALSAATARAAAPPEATVGPAVTVLSRSVLCVPVGGLDELAADVRAALADAGSHVEERPFAGHLTLARGRGGRPVPRSLAGEDVRASWTVGEVRLVASTPGAQGSRYATLASATVRR